MVASAEIPYLLGLGQVIAHADCGSEADQDGEVLPQQVCTRIQVKGQIFLGRKVALQMLQAVSWSVEPGVTVKLCAYAEAHIHSCGFSTGVTETGLSPRTLLESLHAQPNGPNSVAIHPYLDDSNASKRFEAESDH